MAAETGRVSVVIPTLDREEVLVDTIAGVLALEHRPREILVIDQTRRRRAATASRLEAWHLCGAIRWLRLPRRSIPGAMNRGLIDATGELVVFLDDDIVPLGELVAAHEQEHEGPRAEVVVGQVLEPGERPEALAGERFAFRSSVAQEVEEFIGCNFSVPRLRAIELGGFDENFLRVAYRYEADFSARARAAGWRIRFAPAAAVRHLRTPHGGTRTYGSHLKTIRPGHAVGEYYHLIRNRPAGGWRRLVKRPWRAVVTRHHARHPWWIPVTLVAEMTGLVWALALAARGRRLLKLRRIE